VLPGITELADLVRERFGYCQIEHDMKTTPLSPPIVAKKDLLAESKSRKK
jgi:hypothetical protein